MMRAYRHSCAFTPVVYLACMKIGIQTWGSTGDINPFLALAAGLAAAGHQVTLAITATERRDYTALGEQLGFRVIEAGHVGESVEALNASGKVLFATRDPLKQMRMIFDELFSPNAEEMYGIARQLCADNELIIGHFIHHPLHLAAEQAGRPYVTVSLHHGTIPTRFAAPHPLPNLGSQLNPWLWRLTEGIINHFLLSRVNSFRTGHDGAPLASIRDVWESQLCNLIAVSHKLCPLQPDWGGNQHVCGFFNLPEAASSWQPPASLEQFLGAGDAPIYITFGSMMGLPEASPELDEMIALWSEAVKDAGCRAIIQTHWQHAPPVAEDDAIYRIESAAHERIFPRCAAVVHHGGAGTTQSATRAGCPSIVVAHIADQFFWGDQLRRLGIAPPVINRQRLTAKRLAKAIRQVLDEPGMKQRAERVGQAMAAENGVAKAVAIIESLAIKQGSSSSW